MAGVLVGIPLLLLGIFIGRIIAGEKPATIANFHPSEFAAKAQRPFFYSIGDQLKYSDEIDPKAATLLQGSVAHFLVSPDQSKIAVVANGELMVVDSDGSQIRVVTPVSSIYVGLDDNQRKPIGKQFFRDNDFQWTPDSQQLYLIKDQYYDDSSGSQLYSAKGELWRYSLKSGTLELVLKPFPAYTYFFGRNDAVYFSVPTAKGDLRLEYFDGRSVQDIGSVGVSSIQPWELARKDETPFFSFDSSDYWQAMDRSKRVQMAPNPPSTSLTLRVSGKTYLELTQGNGLKGPYYCGNLDNSEYLPGGRYLLLDFSYCGNYDGQLLLDTLNGGYEELPKNTRVYVKLNTESHPSYRISCGGISPN